MELRWWRAVLAGTTATAALAGCGIDAGRLMPEGNATPAELVRAAVSAMHHAHDLRFDGEGQMPVGSGDRSVRFRFLVAGADCQGDYDLGLHATFAFRVVDGEGYRRYSAAAIRLMMPGPLGERRARAYAGRWLQGDPEDGWIHEACAQALGPPAQEAGEFLEEERETVGGVLTRQLDRYAPPTDSLWIEADGPPYILRRTTYLTTGPVTFRLLGHDEGLRVVAPTRFLTRGPASSV